MSGIVLSASVRQNLLSLQSTADLLATTQNRLATGKKVNTALDNPTNYFTAASLDNRASDINNLLDGIGNGVQVLQAANTGITSLQKLVDSAKSVATQALQATVGYAAKSSVSVTINGATASNLLGTGAPIDATFTGGAVNNNQLPVYSSNTVLGTAQTATHQTAYTNTNSTGSVALQDNTPAAVTGATSLDGAAGTHLNAGVLAALSGQVLTINGHTITFSAAATATSTVGSDTTVGLGAGSTSTFGDVLTAIQTAAGAGVTAGVDGTGHITLATGTSNDVTITAGAAATALGITTTNRGGGITSSANITAATKLSGPQVAGGADALTGGQAFTAGDYLIVNNKTITFHSGGGNTGSIATNDLSIDITSGTVNNLLSAINTATGGTATVNGSGQISLATGTTADINFSGSSVSTLAKLGLNALPSNTVARNSTGGASAITGATVLSGAASTSSNALTSAFAAGDTITVNGQSITFVASGAAGNNQINVGDTVTQLLQKFDALTGATPSSSTVSGTGQLQIHTGTTSDLNISSSNAAALAALGLGTGVSQARGVGASPLNTLTLAIGSTGGGTASNVTFGGTGPGHVNTLNDLNAALAPNNLQATLAQDGTLTIITTNDAASSTIGTITGTAAASGQLFFGKSGSVPVIDANAYAARDNLVSQYNNILDQITTTAQDASFNGVNLLTGDTLKLTFNETGKSTLSIVGVNFNAPGLGLATLNAGDFKDNESVNKVVSGLQAASSSLRSQASAFGSNLSIVQIRQDFSKNLINVLQTGSSNLTLADTNEEAANSQALSTRQSIAVSALALANQSQQSVLQLLR